MTKSELIEQALINGRIIADKIKNATSPAEIDSLSGEIKQYTDFLDENFGILNDWDEKSCKLSFMLYMAAEEKDRHLRYYYDNPKNIGNEDVDIFLEMLESKNWNE